MDIPDNQAFEFGDFVLVPKERLLLDAGKHVHLTAKAFDLLVVLVRRSGQLVTKDELLREVWADTFVEEVNLTVNISTLRKALDRGRNGEGMIATVPKRGYRFVAPVMARDAAAGLGNSYIPFQSIAVLPFAADSPANWYLSDGLTEATINGLAQLRRLRVAPRTSTLHYKGLSIEPKDAGRELDVAAVVTASVSQQDDKLRIQVDLVDVARDSQIWGALYEGNPSELIHLQIRFLQDLSRELRLPLSDQETRQLAWRPTESADAYRAYLQGRHDWNRRSEDALKRAIERFQCAIEMDSRFAAAYSGLADCYATLGYLSYISPAETFPAARSYATKALELDASLAEAHASMAFVKLYFDWDWPGANREFQRAIALDPNYAPTHQWYSIYLLAAGRASEAFREIQLAHQRDSLSLPINSDLGFHYYYTGRYEEAVKQLKFVLEMNKDFAPAHLWLGRTYQALGSFEDALAEFRQVEERVREWPVSIAARGFVTGVAGRADEAREILAELKTLASRKFVTPYGVALVHAGLGDNNAAFAWLNKAADERSHWLVWLRLDPRWNRLRADPRFAALLSRIRFPT